MIERDKASPMDLSPQIHMASEFNCRLPEDWKLEIRIMDKAFVAIADQLIGSTIIDLEDRFYSNPLLMSHRSLELRLAKIKKRMTKLKGKKDKEEKDRLKVES